MSLKQFNADVRAVRSRLKDGGLPGVDAVERGDSDGEVVITIIHEKLSMPLPVQLLAQNIDAYPGDNNFLLFTAADNVAASVTSALENLNNYTFGMKLLEAITTLSTHVDNALRSVDGDQDITMEEPQEEEEVESDSSGYGSDCSDIFGLVSEHTNGHTTPRSRLHSSTLRRIKSDLRDARDAGCKVGILDGLELSADTHIFSLSIRASKLALSQEAVEAWDVEMSDYIILLIRVEGMYPSAEKLAEQSYANFHVDFRFGKGAKYKPSPAQARAAFITEAVRNQGASASKAFVLKYDEGRTFEKIFISNSLEQFMRERFLSMVKLRLGNQAYKWDDANEQLRNMSSRTFVDEPVGKPKKDEESMGSGFKSTKKTKSRGNSNGKGNAATAAHTTSQTHEEPRSPKPIPKFLMQDAVTSPPEYCSTPLLAMQFAIHYFVRCTEYCLNCHKHTGTEFEALKPFVCSDPLCLFQYLTMGFGPSVEHEILTQPYVVDLLVSLCYNSIQDAQSIRGPRFIHNPSLTQGQQYRIREFPCGLQLKVPHPDNISPTKPVATNSDQDGDAIVSASSIKVQADLRGRLVTVLDADVDRVTPETWIILREDARFPPSDKAYHHAFVKGLDHQTRTLEIETLVNDRLRATGPVEMDLVLYDSEFDDLDDDGKAGVMNIVLNSLPPIISLREYLIKNPHGKLRSCAGVSPAAATLLEWIVASNRSCILQVTPVEDSTAKDQTLLESIKTRDQEAIPSMTNCVQFRFAQGAPDKELRFHRALKDVKSQINPEYPTLFAWHGSALSNWHSILRCGLDFNQVLNGRAYGDGVYFSQDYNTSSSYAGPGIVSWPNSALNISEVISLCEIVNAPERFVSTSPHLVVNQVDWIQCRYLFARKRITEVYNPTQIITSSGGAAAAGLSGSMNGPRGAVPNSLVLAQDPARTVRGPDAMPLSIPLKAVRTRMQQKSQAPSTSKRVHEAMSSSAETDEEEAPDLEFLFSEDEAPPPPAKRANSARDSSVDTATAQQVTTQRPLTPPQTDFRPGTLDLSGLPRLPLPGWADGKSTKRITGDIKHMQKVQASTPLHELGWYIDFQSMENMFQWIVEFHSFDAQLPLAKEMKTAGITSIVLEVRFGRDYPYSPPFVRVVRPRFLPFASGGGGHITIGGAICMELLTGSGWSPVTSMDAVFVSIRMAMSETERPAHLQTTETSARMFDYGANEALDAYVRFAGTHGWQVPEDLRETATQQDQSR